MINRDGNEYLLRNLVTKKEEWKSVFLLRPFLFDIDRTQPEEVAIKDYQEQFFVEKILDHSGTWSRLGAMRFRIKWVGYEDLTSEPFNELKHNEVFHKYLREQGKVKLIPKRYLTEEDISALRK